MIGIDDQEHGGMSMNAHSGSEIPVDLDGELARFIREGGLKRFPVPGAAIEAGSIMWDVDYKTDELAKTIAKDKELSAEFVRRANSAALARAGGCASVASAINRLGAEQTAFMLIAHRYGEQIAIDGPLLPLRARIWREGLTSARLCEALAKARRMAGHEGFLCGLNHDIGRAITVGCLEMILVGRRSVPAMPESTWTEFVERQHVSMGSTIAELWNMAPAIREVVAAHHLASFEGQPQAELLAIVRVADAVNAGLAESSHVSLESLAATPGIRAGEVPVIAKVLEEIPRFIADMERHSKKPLWGLVPIRPLICHEGAAIHGSRPLAVPATCASGGKPHHYKTQAISAERLLVRGKDPLREHFLTDVTLEVTPEVRFWAEVMSCSKQDGLFELVLRPFALSVPEFRAWSRLV